VLTARIPEQLMEDLKFIEKDEKAERAEIIRRLLDSAVKEWKLRKALIMISQETWTIRKAAKFVGLTYYQLLDKMEKFDVEYGQKIADLRK
jgi:formate dehydrogenase maturation protein FdhE